MKRIKPYSRSCTEKYERGGDRVKRSSGGGGNNSRSKRVLLSECFVNGNIGRKWAQLHG